MSTPLTKIKDVYAFYIYNSKSRMSTPLTKIKDVYAF